MARQKNTTLKESSQKSNTAKGASLRWKIPAAVVVVAIALVFLMHERSLLERLSVTGSVEVRMEPIGQGSSGVRGVFATQDISQGGVIFSIPREVCLTKNNVQPLAKEICKTRSWECLTAKDQLVLGLVLERRSPRPGFVAYVQDMSSGAFNFKSFGPELEAIAAAWAPDFVLAFDRQVKSLVEMGKALEPPISEEEALLAKNAISARAFKIGDTSVLMPGLDLANHQFEPHTSMGWPECDKIHCTVRALRNISRGEQVLINYGEMSNMVLFLRYGFTVSGNPFGPLIPASNIFKKKLPWLEQACSLGVLHRGPLLFATPQVMINGTLRDRDLRCIFYDRAFETSEAASLAFQERFKEIENCLPQGDPSSCEVRAWKLVNAAIHKALHDECVRQDLWEEVNAVIPAVEALQNAGNKMAREILETVHFEHTLLKSCAQHYGEAAEAWMLAAHGVISD